MAEPHVSHDDDDDEEDAAREHALAIADRVIESIEPDELPSDVDPGTVAYFLWRRLTEIMFSVGYTADELIEDVRTAQLEEAEPEGSA
jgi:hypothetical protein